MFYWLAKLIYGKFYKQKISPGFLINPVSHRSVGGSSARKDLTRKTPAHKKAQDFSWALAGITRFRIFGR